MQGWKQSSIRAFRFATASLTRPRLDYFTLFAASLAVLGTILVLFRQVPYGAGITGDAIAYISTAQNLLEENRFATWNRQIYADYPPLFPLLLALIGIFGPAPAESAGWLNAIVFGLTVFVSALYLRRRVRFRFLLVWTCVVLVLSWPLATVSFWAQTEASFIFFIVLSLFSFDRFLETGKHPFLIWAAIFTALACLDRYIGVSLACSIVLLLWRRRETAVRKKIGASFVYAVIALSPLCLWLLRNFLLLGKPTGTRPPRLFSLQENVESGLVTFGEWIVGRVHYQKLIDWLTVTLGREFSDSNLGAFLVTILALGLLVAGFGSSFIQSDEKKRPPYPDSISIFVVFMLSYLCLITPALSVQGVEPLNNRYLAPIYIPILLIVVFVLDRFFKAPRQSRLKFVISGQQLFGGGGALVVCLCSWLIWQVKINIGEIQRLTDFGGGYRSREWTESETIRYLKRHFVSRDIRVYTNDRRALYIWLIAIDAKTRLYGLPATRRRLDKARRRHRSDEDIIVWLHASAKGRGYGPNLQDLLTLPGLEAVAKFADGIVLRLGEDEVNTVMDVYRSEYQSTVSSPPVIHAFFDVYLDQNHLIYVKYPCDPVDSVAYFFLHITPRDLDDLPIHRQWWNFDNRDFDFYESSGVRFDDKCIVTIPLPYYDIRRISTGQYTDEDRLWEADVSFDEWPNVVRPSSIRRLPKTESAIMRSGRGGKQPIPRPRLRTGVVS